MSDRIPDNDPRGNNEGDDLEKRGVAMNIYKDPFHCRGILKFHSSSIPDSVVPEVVQSLKTYLPVFTEGVDNDRNYLDKISCSLRNETIDHSTFCRKSVPKQQDLNYHLVNGIWKFVKSWSHQNLKFTIRDACPISVVEKDEMRCKDAAGLFCYKAHSRKCEIQILKSILDDTQYFLITLVHEYLHYVHYSLVSTTDYHNCPRIFAEGFSEYGSRIFYEHSGYNIQNHLKKSWNTSYEMGRELVSQICSEGFGIFGFTNGFLRNVETENPWKSLDHLF